MWLIARILHKAKFVSGMPKWAKPKAIAAGIDAQMWIMP